MKEAHYAHGWLAAVLPASGRRFRVADETLAGVLAAVGAELVEDSPDVEIATAPEQVRGDASLGIVTVDPPPRSGGGPLVRASSRLAMSLRARRVGRRARSQLRRAGYRDASVLLWDVTQRVELPFLPPLERSLAERLPRRALALGRHGRREPTVLEAALAAAKNEAGQQLRPRWASIRAGTIVVAADSAILRVAIGPVARSQIHDQVAALEELRRSDVPPVVATRIPWLLGHGRVGLADWSLERLLPGTRPRRELSDGLLDECLAFLVGLHRAGGGGQRGRSFTELAETVARICRPETAAVVRALAERLENDLAGLERGFGHGDFFAGNMLAEGDRLTGVLDWDAAGSGRPPVVDVLHLQLTRTPYRSDEHWGRAVIERLLPSARGGGDPLVRRYGAELGLDADSRLLEALVFAYWLEYVAYQLRAHPDRLSSPAWIEGNVTLVAREGDAFMRAASPGGARAPRTHTA